MRTRRRKKDNVVLMAAVESDIATRAYEKFLARGGEHGHDVDDWLQAESELRHDMAKINHQSEERAPDEAGRATVGIDFFG